MEINKGGFVTTRECLKSYKMRARTLDIPQPSHLTKVGLEDFDQERVIVIPHRFHQCAI
jgi:hypothetical protein